MKKIIFSFLLNFLILGYVLSNPITKEAAIIVAKNYYATNSLKTDISVKDVYVNKYEGENSFYTVIFNSGGFVIVSADDYAIPVLAYSFVSDAPVDIENAGVKEIFGFYNKQIDLLRKLKEENSAVKEMWVNLKNEKSNNKVKAVAPLLTTTWNQSPYYNMYCPTGTPTGCVATAMSQILNYHEWPVTGKGWHEYIVEDHPEYGEQFADFANGNYDWANMVDNLNVTNTDTEKQAIAKLMQHCGVSVNMNYDPSGSGAQSRDVLFALVNYFSCDASTIQYISYNSSDNAGWLTQVKNEIDNNRPVYYDGYGTSGGHAWVCDGYDDSDKIHINWGWGGSYNGYFAPNSMAPGTANFTDGNNAIIGIQPGNPSAQIEWTKQASGFVAQSRGIQYISAVDRRTAWAVAYDGSGGSAKVKDYTRTTDGGNTWVSGTINAANTTNYSSAMISAIDENTAWVPLFGPTGGGMIVKTEDGGKSWTQQSTAAFSAPNGFPNVVHFWDENNGFCQGDPNGGYFELYTTTDGGTTWVRVPQGNIPANITGEYGTVGYYAVFDDIIWFATNKGRIFKSTDKGFNWVAYQTPFSDASFELSFRGANNGVIQKRKDGDNTAYRTADGGENWSIITTTGNFYTNSLKYIPGTNTLLSTGSDWETPLQGVSYSTDDGSTFTDYADYYQNFQFLSIGAASEDAIWIGGYNSSQYSDGMWHYGDIPIVAEFTADYTDLCLGSATVLFTDASKGSPDSWNWDFGDNASPSTAIGQGPHSVTYSATGNKTVTLEIDKVTDNHQVIKSDYIRIADTAPDAASDITGDLDVNVGETYTYSVTNQDNVIFEWSLPSTNWEGSSVINSIDIYFTDYARTGRLTVVPTNGCGTGTSSYIDITTHGSVGTFDVNEKDTRFLVYPNPAKDKISITNLMDTRVYIYNNLGSLMKAFDIKDDSQEVNVSNFKTGLYYLKFENNNQRIVLSFNIIE
ncbi:MAG: C10 family peptidase [Bacteroidales bacterium]|nr:C10 family peptidase [Bacteroidales bacterium]